MTLAKQAQRLRDMEELRLRYVAAYEAANKRTPEITYNNGWFRIRGVGNYWSNHREAQVRDMCRALENRAAGFDL